MEKALEIATNGEAYKKSVNSKLTQTKIIVESNEKEKVNVSMMGQRIE